MAISENNQRGYSIFDFLAYAHVMLLLFLSISVVLPDKISNKDINLKEYYFQHHKYYWSLMVAVNILPMLIYIVPKIIHSNPLNISNMIIFIISTLLTTLAISKKYWIHAVLLVFFTLMVMLDVVSKF